jgi:glycerol-3-phosphate O-acyltransferase
MSGSLTLSWWLFVPLAVLAALGFWGFVVLPLARAVLRARRHKVVAALNPKLQLAMPPFQLTRREFLADRLANDPKIVALAEETAQVRGVPVETVRAEVAAYAHEIVPAFNPYFYFRFGYMAARSFMRSLYRVRLGYHDAAALAKVSSEDSVVFFCNHRSNIDYVLVTYLAAGNTTLSFGVGEWARHWPFQQLMRSAGAYFVRRDAKDPLYRRVLERYVQLATEARVTQALFPEGALSRDGGLQTPKLGLLDYMTNSFDRDGPRDIVFMPIGVNYDRVPEEWNLITDRDLALKKKGDKFVLRLSLLFLFGTLWLKTRRWRHPFGYAVANFATPVSLKAWLAQHGVDLRSLPRAERFRWVARLADDLMGSVAAAIPVLPSGLIAAVLTEALAETPDRAVPADEIRKRALARAARLEAAGARVYSPRHGAARAIDEGLRMLTHRKLVTRSADGFRPVAAKLPLLSVYANAIAHLDREPEKATAQ